jgi:uncharacterized protein (TIGR04255 family)
MGRLANAPLQEVIFEVRWEADVDPVSGAPTDREFSMASGRFHVHVEDRFPHVDQRQPFYDMAPQAFMYQAIRQYRPAKDLWPLFQLGPVVFTVNDTNKDYDWGGKFSPLIDFGLEKLEKAYEGPLPYSNVALRYIDAVKVSDYDFVDWASFIPGHLNFSFKNEFDSGMVPRDVSFQQLFDLGDGSQLHLNISSGKDAEGNEQMIWQTTVMRSGSFTRQELLTWVEGAHAKSSDLFTRVCKPHFHASFD